MRFNLEAVSKVAVGLLSVVYAVGIMVVTLHLAGYGASGLGLLRAQYILAGVWALLPLLATGFVFASVVLAIQDELQAHTRRPHATRPDDAVTDSSETAAQPRLWRRLRSPWRYVRDVAISTIGWVVAAGFFLKFATASVPFYDPELATPASFLKTGLAIVGFTLVISLFALATWFSLRGPDPRNPVRAAVYGALTVVALLGYLGFFTTKVYAHIPAALGGGSPIPVEIILKADSLAASSALHRLPGNPLPSFPHQRLLFATERTITLVNPNDPTGMLEISRDLVSVLRTSRD